MSILINISRIIQRKEECLLIEFETKCGQGRGCWHGDLPQDQGTYDAEINIGDTFTWGSNIRQADNREYFLKLEGDTLVFQGCVELKWENDLISLALDEAASDAIDVFAPGAPINSGDFVRCVCKDVSLSDTGY